MPILPHLYPIPVVRIIVADRQNRVLILKRAPGTTGGGLWCLPGGKVNCGETVEEAARRELLQETGLFAEDLTFHFYQDNKPETTGAAQYLNLYFSCRSDDQPVLNEESSDLTWVQVDDITGFNFAFDNNLALLRYWQKPSR
jgi:8-oxo-dGTP diphosphatase